MPVRRSVVAVLLVGIGVTTGALVTAPSASSIDHSSAAPATAKNGAQDFDFLVGRWNVHHRTLRKDPSGTRQWIDFEGTAANQKLLDGFANVEDHVMMYPSGTRHGVALRSFDPTTGLWSIWWLDHRYPQGPLDPPVRGRFQDGVGTFFSNDVVDGKPIVTRFIWSHITAVSARWEQATSADKGSSWETNWVMDFSRAP